MCKVNLWTAVLPPRWYGEEAAYAIQPECRSFIASKTYRRDALQKLLLDRDW